MRIGALDVRLDPWGVEYGSETPGVGEVLPEAEVKVTPDVEMPVAGWREVRPPVGDRPSRLIFVDGVRRMEGRLVVTAAGQVTHGAIGSFAVGAVICEGTRAAFGEHRIDRLAILGGGQSINVPLALGGSLTYRPHSAADADADAPVRELHTCMRQAEEQFAGALASAGGFVIADGPLNISYAGTGQLVGFVKRLVRLYLESDLLNVVASLSAGARSPVFLIDRGRFSRYSWFVRLAAPLRMESPFTGLVRLEIAESVGKARAIELADVLTACLPAFVPSRTRDPRAPQNLLPIGALERHLRHLLGDARLIHRRLATLLASESAHV